MTTSVDSPLAATATTLAVPDSAPLGYKEIIHGTWATAPEDRTSFKDVLFKLREVYRVEVEKEKQIRAARSKSNSSLSNVAT
jgi:hypothetical protein